MNKNNWLNLFFLLLMKIKYVIIKELEWEVSTKNEGQLMLSELERELNQLYSEVYQENYDKKEVGKEE